MIRKDSLAYKRLRKVWYKVKKGNHVLTNLAFAKKVNFQCSISPEIIAKNISKLWRAQQSLKDHILESECRVKIFDSFLKNMASMIYIVEGAFST